MTNKQAEAIFPPTDATNNLGSCLYLRIRGYNVTTDRHGKKENPVTKLY